MHAPINLQGVRVIAAIGGLELFGHERGNIEVFKALREAGAEVIVGVSSTTLGGINQVEKTLCDLGFDTFQLPFGVQWSIQWVKKDPRIAYTNLLAVAKCSRIFYQKMRQFDSSHVHLGSPLTYSYLSLALAVTATPVIYRMGDCAPEESPFNLRIWKMAMRRSAHIVAISNFVRLAAISAGVAEDRISIIHNLAPSAVNDRNDAATWKSSVKPSEESTIRLLYAGAISAHKGLLPLVRAFAVVASEHDNLQLDIIGGSRYDIHFREELIRLIAELGLQDKITLHGHVETPLAYFQRASIHLAPSICDEALGNVVLEAKREGVPSIIFPSGGLPEMIHNQLDGYICKEKSVDALVEGLSWMLKDPERLMRLAKAARADSQQRFGPERFAAAWANVYLDTINNA